MGAWRVRRARSPWTPWRPSPTSTAGWSPPSPTPSPGPPSPGTRPRRPTGGPTTPDCQTLGSWHSNAIDEHSFLLKVLQEGGEEQPLPPAPAEALAHTPRPLLIPQPCTGPCAGATSSSTGAGLCAGPCAGHCAGVERFLQEVVKVPVLMVLIRLVL